MFQFIDTFDGNTAGGTYFIDFYAGMRIIIQYQFGCSLYRLSHHSHCIFGINPHFYTGLHGSLDVFQHISDSAGSHGSAGCEFFFGDQHGKSHLIENIQHQLFLFFGRITTGNQCHTFHLADGGVRNNAEHGHFRFGYVVSQLFKVDACSNRNDNLFTLQFQLAQHTFDKPRFHSEYDEFGADDGFLIVMGDL